MLVYTPVLVAIIGCLIYVLSAHAKIAEMGRIMFFCGLLAAMMSVGSWHLGH